MTAFELHVNLFPAVRRLISQRYETIVCAIAQTTTMKASMINPKKNVIGSLPVVRVKNKKNITTPLVRRKKTVVS